jgi:sRNA-binding regulator protein Hfq
MKTIAFLLLLLLAFGNSFAQKNKKDVVYLKNGSVLKGQQTRVDDDKVVVRSGKNLWVFSDADIDTIASKRLPQIFEFQSKPFFLKTTAGLLIGGSNNPKPTPFSFDASLNFKLFPTFYFGLGAGVDFLEESYLPTFGSFELRFRDARSTPFIGVKGGYMFPLDDNIHAQTYYGISPSYSSYWPGYTPQQLESEGGQFFEPSFGFVSQISENLGLMLSFGYRYHQVSFKGEDHYKLEREYNRLSIRLGIIFN